MKKTTEYYLSKGFDLKTAEYYAGGRRKLVGVEAREDFTLELSFDNGEKRLYDMRPLLNKGTVFEKLYDMRVFMRAYIDECHAVAWDIDPAVDSSTVWSNKVDLCPDSCYLDSCPIA